MSYYKAGEILEKAIEMEQKGASFYDSLAEQAENEEIRNTLLYLAGEERSHEENFSSLLEKAGEFKTDFSYDYYDYLAGLEFMSVQGVFEADNKTVRQAALSKDFKELIRTALQFEQDSIFFYNELRPIVDEKASKILDEIIRQERKHIIKLNEVLSLCAN